jgi:long-chain fatty acid transport protein
MPQAGLYSRQGIRATWVVAAPLAMFAPGAALANGFQVRTGSPDWTANAFAGIGAKGYDAGSAWNNPAAMTLLDNSEVDTGLNVIMPHTEFSGSNFIGPITVPGSTGGDAGQTAVTPGLEAVWSTTPRLKFGLAVEVPFGLRTVYPSNFVGRYQANVSSISDLQIGLSVAYRLTDHLSVGAGPILDTFQARLTNAINTGPTAALTGDPAIDIHGSDWSAGYHFGALYEFNQNVRAGIDYRSRFNEGVSGQQSIFIPPTLAALSPATARLLAAGNTDASTRVTLPDVLTLSLYADLSEEWSVMATAQWTHWSVLQELSVIGANGASEALPLKFRSTWFGSVGANYHPHWAPKLMLQTGVGFDQSPVDNATRSPRLPTRNDIPLGVGLAYAFRPDVSIQLAYLHEFSVGDSGTSFSNGPTAGILLGSYSNSVNVVSVGSRWIF